MGHCEWTWECGGQSASKQQLLRWQGQEVESRYGMEPSWVDAGRMVEHDHEVYSHQPSSSSTHHSHTPTPDNKYNQEVTLQTDQDKKVWHKEHAWCRQVPLGLKTDKETCLIQASTSWGSRQTKKRAWSRHVPTGAQERPRNMPEAGRYPLGLKTDKETCLIQASTSWGSRQTKKCAWSRHVPAGAEDRPRNMSDKYKYMHTCTCLCQTSKCLLVLQTSFIYGYRVEMPIYGDLKTCLFSLYIAYRS